MTVHTSLAPHFSIPAVCFILTDNRWLIFPSLSKKQIFSEKDEYVRIEKDLESVCRSQLDDCKIQFSWQSRMKEIESLRKKLQDCRHNYGDDLQNIADIKDLVAGRIILTRWKDFGLVEEMIRLNFDLKGRSQHPKSDNGTSKSGLHERFRGYDGLHFHVTRQVPKTLKFSDLVIEIQIVSVYTWASQMISHDYIYKQMNGKLSKELALQFEIFQGISNMGAVALEQLEELLAVDINSPISQHNAACSDISCAIAELHKIKCKAYLQICRIGRKTRRFCRGYRKSRPKAIMIKLGQCLGIHMKIRVNGFGQHLITGLRLLPKTYFGS